MNLKSTLFLALSLTGLSWQQAHAQSYCTPTANYGCDWANIESFSTTGGLMNITNNGTGCGSNDYSDYTATMTHIAVQGDVVNFSFNVGGNTTYSSGDDCGFKIWVDFNGDGDFDDADELVYENAAPGSYSYLYYNNTETGSFTVPATATVGTTRLRIRCLGYENDFDACSFNYSDGEAEDYAFQIVPDAPPDNAGIDSLVNPPVNGLFCSGNQEVKVRLRNLGENGLNSVNIHWSIDGIDQPPVSYNAYVDSIASPANWTIVNLGTVNFPFNTPVAIKAWTSDPNGMTDSDFSDDTLSVTVNSAKQNVDVHINPQDTSICLGDAIVLDAGVQPSGAIYVWNTGDVTQSISVDQGGTYFVKVQSLGGCTNRDTITITELPQPQADNLGVVDNGGNNYTFTVNGQQHIDAYDWDFGDQTTDSGPGPKSHTYTQPGLYVVSVTVGNTCNSINFTRQIQIETTGVPDIDALEQVIDLYPNPAKNTVKLEIKGAVSLHHVSVFNVVGQQVLDANISGPASTELNISSFANGLYQVVMDTDKGQVIKKLEIVK